MRSGCCGDEEGNRCWLPYLQSGYTERLNYGTYEWDVATFEAAREYKAGSYFEYPVVVNDVSGRIVGPGSAYVSSAYTAMPWLPSYVQKTNRKTQYRYRDRQWISYPISDASISLTDEYVYTGEAFTPEPVITYNGTQLVKGVDYTLSYANNTEPGVANVTVTGMGFYDGVKSAPFRINKAANTMVCKAKRVTVKGSKIAVKAQVVKPFTVSGAQGAVTYTMLSGPRGAKINANTGELTLPKGLATNAYQVKVAIEAAGDAHHVGAQFTMTIKAIVQGKTTGLSISGAEVSPIGDYVYSNKAAKPNPKVTYEGVSLKKGTDYTLSYQNNKKIGKAQVVLTGKGIFQGTKKVSFTIGMPAPKARMSSNGGNSLAVKWGWASSVPQSFKADWYQVTIMDSAGKSVSFTVSNSKNASSYQLRKVIVQSGSTIKIRKGKTYRASIAACKKVGSTTYSAVSNVAQCEA